MTKLLTAMRTRRSTRERNAQAAGSSTSLAPRSSTVSSAKFEVEKFNGINYFGMWQCEVKDVLIQQDLDLALEDKRANLEQKHWDRLHLQACCKNP